MWWLRFPASSRTSWPKSTLQAMKTEIAVESEHAGTVEAVLVREGQEVDLGAVLARVRTA